MADVAECLPCPPGSSCNGSSTAIPCTEGSYGWAGVCQTCPNGTYTETPGEEECLPCEAGYECYHGDRTPCDPGLFAEGFAMACVECPPGRYADSEGKFMHNFSWSLIR